MPSTWCCLRQRNEHHMPTMRTSRNWRTTLSASWGRLPVDEPQMLTTTAQYKPLHSVRAVVVVPERLFSMASKAQQQVTFGNCHMASALSKKGEFRPLDGFQSPILFTCLTVERKLCSLWPWFCSVWFFVWILLLCFLFFLFQQAEFPSHDDLGTPPTRPALVGKKTAF